MQHGEPSRTARGAAAHRAAHQVLEQGRIFADPLALRILGDDAATVARDALAHPSRRAMRFFIAARTRFAEDALAAAVERGLRQAVVLGAGLDTFAYRSPLRERLRIFEVDHPATQAWKRRRLAEAEIAVPASLTYAPVDFENETLADGLAAADFDPQQETFFTWLGVVPYLTAEAIWSTLRYIAGLSGGAHVVFDYGEAPGALAPDQRAAHAERAARVAALGEPWITAFEPDALRAELTRLGFSEVEDLGPPELVARYAPANANRAPKQGGHVIRATVQRDRYRRPEYERSDAVLTIDENRDKHVREEISPLSHMPDGAFHFGGTPRSDE